MAYQKTNRNDEETRSRPTHRVTFARIIGKDRDGNDRLGPAREIGAIWPRKNGKKGGILKFDHIPVGLGQQGVLFILPTEDKRLTDDQPNML